VSTLPVVQGMRRSITYSVLAGLAIAAVVVVIVAVGGGDGDNGNASAANAGAGSGLVSVQNVDGTDVLVDSEGKTLYSADVEKAGIRCTDGCTSFWEPLAASANEANSAASDLDLDLGVVKRPDGGSQLTFKGLPVYSFTEEGPGQLDGDGFVDNFQGTHFEWAAATMGASSAPSGSNAPSDSSPY
jgi:predicted lipoprotein with Yx(FWY)xxD motif